MSQRLAAALVLVVLSGTASVASAQAPADPVVAPAASPEAQTATRVHDEGRYPDDIAVLDDDETDQSARAGASEGAGHGPTGRIGRPGDRDGGEVDTSVPIPFVQDILNALARLLGAAARPIGYVLFALGIALVIALVVYLVVMMRLPRSNLETTRRRDGGNAPEAALDPLLEGSDASAEEHAAHGRFREAIHALFLRALREATRAGDVERRGRTAREVVSLVERAHGALPPLAALLSLTELVWFGGRPATEAQYLEARELAAATQSAARAHGPAMPVGAPA